MELTQIQGQNPGLRVPVTGGQPINVGSAPGSQIINPNLPRNSAQIIPGQGGEQLIKPMIKSSPVVINGQSVGGPTPIKYGDTIAIGKNNDVILGVHRPGEQLDLDATKRHLGNLNFSPDQINEITKKLFNYKENQIIKIPLFSVAGLVAFLFIGVIYGFFKLSQINTEITTNTSKFNDDLKSAKTVIENLKSALGVELGGSSGGDCDPEDSSCVSGGPKSIDERISELSKKVTEFNNKLSDADKNFGKLQSSLSGSLSSALEGEGAKVLKKEIIDDLKEGSIKEFQTSLEGMKNDFKTLDNTLGDIVEKMKADIKDFAQYSSDLKSLKEVRDFMRSYDTDKALVDKKVTLSEEEIKNIKNDISGLDKRIDTLDSSLKKTNEVIDSLDLKIKNIGK